MAQAVKRRKVGLRRKRGGFGFGGDTISKFEFRGQTVKEWLLTFFLCSYGQSLY